MAKYSAFLLILLVISGFQHEVICDENMVISMMVEIGASGGNAFKVGESVLGGVQKLYNMLQPKTTQESESDIKQESGMEQRITDQIKKVSKQISALKVNMQNMKNEIIDKILTELPEEMSLRDNLKDIYLRINQVENLYQNYGDYVLNPRNFSIRTLEDFAVHATAHDLNELPNVLKTMHWMLVQTDTNSGESILSILSKTTQSPTKMCQRQQSLQQMIYLLYEALATADIKGHTMIQYGFMLLETITGESRLAEKAQALQQFKNRMYNTLHSVKKAMRSASRVVWKCDNDGFRENVTFTRFNSLITRYTVNEVDINSGGSCTGSCSDYTRTKVYGCFNGKICKEQRTCSQIWDCEYKIGGTMWICPSDKDNNRRYEYIEYGNSQRFGPQGTCKTPAIDMKSWGRGTVDCTYCTCTCDDVDYAESDRYVNLRDVFSALHQNYVVTGVRLRKVNHILHIQIQEGLLLPGGLIDPSTVRWVKIEDYKVGEVMPETVGTKWEYIPRESHDYAILIHKDGRRRYGEDYERRAAFNLDDLDFVDNKANTNHIVVGVRFNLCDVEDSGEHINLEIFMVPFNFTSGKIDYLNVQSVLYSKCRSETGIMYRISKSDKTEVILRDLDIPTNGAGTVPTSQTNQFLYLKPSSMDTDAGQNTVPFLDIQDIVSYPSAPLSGLGLFHKSSPGTGGFLSLKLFTFNYAPHLGEKAH